MPPEEPKDPKDTIINAIMKNWEKHRWMKFRSALHLHSEEAAERLTSLLALHLLLDRAIEAILSVQLLGPGSLKGKLGQVAEAIRRVTFSNRIDIAKAAGLISGSCAADIKAVNKVRNKVSHSQPKSLDGGVSVAPELSSPKDFEKCMVRGERAFDELMANINHLLLGIGSPRNKRK
ncbi:MAG: hypothetical protein OJF51_004858 [Nitrospira sp.]|jgi:hypothetical protein|nr:MAG: hypothetical protein OJF51_004858 [Nitrospira sp.]